MHRSFPARKTLGTGFNLRPATLPGEARHLQPGDVVVLEVECPVVLTRVMRHRGGIRTWGRYIWQADRDQPWPLEPLGSSEHVERALPGEYRTATDLPPTR